MANTIPVRLSEVLYGKAEAVAKREFRTPPKQIELWAEFGYRASEYMTTQDLIAVSQGLMQLKCEAVETAPLDADNIFSSLFDEAKQRRVSQNVKDKGSFVFEASRHCPGKLDQVFKDGTRLTGQFTNGEFIPER